MNTNDFAAAAAWLDDGYVLEWPQSGERIRGRANFVAINAQYPAAGPWRFRIERLVADSHAAVSDVLVTDGVTSARAITFSDVRNGKIMWQVEYWPDPFPAPAWRAALAERDP